MISKNQLMFFMLSLIIGTGIIKLPSVLARDAGHLAWLSILVGGLLMSVLALWTGSQAVRVYPDSLFSLAKKKWGIAAAWSIYIPLIIYFITFCTVEIKQTQILVNFSLLPSTSVYIIIAMLLGPAIYANFKGLTVITRTTEFVIPAILLLSVLALAMVIPYSYSELLRPFFYGSVDNIVIGVKDTAFSYLGFEALLLLSPYMKAQRIKRPVIIAIGLVTLLYTAIIVLTTATFGIEETARLTYPTYELQKVVHLTKGFIERVDIVFVTFWAPVMIMIDIGWSFLVVESIQQAAGVSRKVLIIPVFLVMLILSLLIPNQLVLDRINSYVAPAGIAIIAIYPALIVLLTRNRGGEQNEA